MREKFDGHLTDDSPNPTEIDLCLQSNACGSATFLIETINWNKSAFSIESRDFDFESLGLDPYSDSPNKVCFDIIIDGESHCILIIASLCMNIECIVCYGNFFMEAFS
jgi:hypothetical protein